MADIVNVTPDPRTTPVGQVVIGFRDATTLQPTSVTGVSLDDFTLTRDGNDVSLAGLNVIGSGDAYSLDLSTVTGLDGAYVLTLVASGSGIVDFASLPLTQDAIDDWVIDTAAPSADIVNVSPDPRNTAVGNVTISFDEDVEGVNIDNFKLTRDGAVVSLAGLTVNGSGANYTLNLSTVTGASGTYVLTLDSTSSEIRDSVGNPLSGDATDTWTTDTSAPTASIAPVTLDPRNTAVGNVAITFSEPVSGVDINDFTLTRNGATVALTGLTVSGSGAAYTLNLSTVTATAGTYVLTLVANGSGIADGLGNLLAANASDTWINDTTAPTADIVDISPDPRTTPVGTVTINFSEPVSGVDINDFTLRRNGTDTSWAGLTVGGSGATYTIDLSSLTATFGTYTLTLVAAGSGIVDLSGNALTANASDTWTSDDAGEQNDTLRTAYDLGRLNGPVSLGPLGMVDANDWFRFTTSAKGAAGDNVTISFQNSGGNLDLELYNVSGQKLKSSTGSGNTETVSLNGLKAGTYHIRVFGKAGAINPSYTLTINAPRVPVDDAFEQNDTRTTASNLGTFVAAATISNLALLDGHDWYRFSTTTAGTSGNSVVISFLNSQGNLNLELYNSSGTRVGVSSTAGNSEQISLAGRAAGTYYVHILAASGARHLNYSLKINPPTTAAFNIQYQFSGTTANQVVAFQQAAQKWQSIIAADLPSANYFSSGATTSIVVDDVLIDVGAVAIDGVGTIVGGSAPDAFRAGSGLPYHGVVLLDTADLASLQADGLLSSVAIHEIAHVLGFGTIWADKGLLAGAGTSDPQFTGVQAVAAYNAIFGTGAAGVPVEDAGSEGTAESHWRESVLGNELLTGFVGPGTTNPLSQITIASMADLGYTVNLAAADPYTKPSSLSLVPVQKPASKSNPSLVSSAALDALLANWSALSSDSKKWTFKA